MLYNYYNENGLQLILNNKDLENPRSIIDDIIHLINEKKTTTCLKIKFNNLAQIPDNLLSTFFSLTPHLITTIDFSSNNLGKISKAKLKAIFSYIPAQQEEQIEIGKKQSDPCVIKHLILNNNKLSLHTDSDLAEIFDELNSKDIELDVRENGFDGLQKTTGKANSDNLDDAPVFFQSTRSWDKQVILFEPLKNVDFISFCKGELLPQMQQAIDQANKFNFTPLAKQLKEFNKQLYAFLPLTGRDQISTATIIFVNNLVKTVSQNVEFEKNHNLITDDFKTTCKEILADYPLPVRKKIYNSVMAVLAAAIVIILLSIFAFFIGFSAAAVTSPLAFLIASLYALAAGNTAIMATTASIAGAGILTGVVTACSLFCGESKVEKAINQLSMDIKATIIQIKSSLSAEKPSDKEPLLSP